MKKGFEKQTFFKAFFTSKRVDETQKGGSAFRGAGIETGMLQHLCEQNADLRTQNFDDVFRVEFGMLNKNFLRPFRAH